MTLDHMTHQGPSLIRFSQFTSLRHLKFIIACCIGPSFEAKQEALASFLSAQTGLITATSVVVDIYLELNCWDFEDPRKTLIPGPGWAALDDALTNSLFIHLRTVSLNIKAFHRASGISFGQSKAEGRMNAFTLLPVLASGMPWLDVEVNLESIFCPTAFVEDYLCVLFFCSHNFFLNV